MTRPPLMIFAAGFGTRMRALTRDRPKPMLKVGGVPLIDRALHLADAAGVTRIVVNTHYLAPMLEEHLSHRHVRISREWPDILDTGGGLKQAIPLIDSPVVMTMNPDVLWLGDNPLDCAWQAWEPGRMDALLLCIPLNRAIGRVGAGDFDVAPDGRVTRPGNLVFGGVHIIKTAQVARMDARVFPLTAVWDKALTKNRCSFVEYPGHWCDVGTPEALARAEQAIAEHV